MNFDTKYLIRWGIPGWIFLITVLPYLYYIFQEDSEKLINQANGLALGAAITLIGIPLGYFFNQLHHFISWVIFKDNWGSYFEEEVKLDLFLAEEKNKGLHERYRYLLSKKHEVGSVFMSFGMSGIIMLFLNLRLYDKNIEITWGYLIATVIFTVIWFALRQYASKNALTLYNKLLFLAKKDEK